MADIPSASTIYYTGSTSETSENYYTPSETSENPEDHRAPHTEDASENPEDHRVPHSEDASENPEDHRAPHTEDASENPEDHRAPHTEDASENPEDHRVPHTEDASENPEDHRAPHTEDASENPEDHRVPHTEDASENPEDHRAPHTEDASENPEDHRVPHTEDASENPEDHRAPHIEDASENPEDHRAPHTEDTHFNSEEPRSYSWKQKLYFVVIGVWVFCSTPLLSLPFAIKEGGWLGMCFFCGFGVLTFLTAWLLPYFLDGEENYQEMGNTALGATGRWIGFVLSCVFSYATCIDCVMINYDNLYHVFPAGAEVLIVFLVIVMAVLLWYNTFNEYDAFYPYIGLLLTVVVVLCLAYQAIFDVQMHARTESFNYPTLHLAVGFYAYCFCGHAYMPKMYLEIDNRTLYRNTIIITFLISIMIYAFTGCIAYNMYGVDIESIFTLNFPPKAIVSQIAIYSTVMTHMIRYELNMSTLVTTLEKIIPEARRTQLYIRPMKFVLVMSTLVGIFGTPIYATLVSLSGSVIGILMSLTIPSLCFFIKDWENQQAPQVPAFIRIQAMVWSLALLVGICGAGFTIVRSILAMD